MFKDRDIRKRMQDSHNFAWSVGPITKWLGLIGVNVEQFTSANKFRDFLKNGLSFLLFILNFACCVTAFLLFFFGPNRVRSVTYSWTVAINILANSLSVVAVHLVLLVRVKRHWPSFKENVVLLESEIQIPESCYRKLRRLAAIGVCYTVVKESFLTGIRVVYHVSSNNTILRKIFDTSIWALRIYPTSALVLWFVSVLHLTWSLESVRCQVEEMATKRLMLSTREISTQIHRWKRNHVTICRTVEALNSCFGIFTLIEIPCIFAIFIANSFGLLFVTIEGRSAVLHVSYSIVLLQHFSHLLAITNAADRMSDETLKLTGAVHELLWHLPKHRKELYSFIEYIYYYSVPRICSTGFFHISRRLVPTLIGTTLTYMVIMYQFHYGNK